MLDEELAKIAEELGNDAYEQQRFPEASEILKRVVLSPTFVDFITVVAYEYID